MLNLSHELASIVADGTDEVLTHAQQVASWRSDHWQTVTSGPHFAVLAAAVDAEAGTMAVRVVDGTVTPVAGHLLPYDRSARHGAARTLMEQAGLSVDIDRAHPVGVFTQSCTTGDAGHFVIVVLWERSAAVRADLAGTVEWRPLAELTADPDETVARTAGLVTRALAAGVPTRSHTLR